VIELEAASSVMAGACFKKVIRDFDRFSKVSEGRRMVSMARSTVLL
jgi:hypothetical protein